MKMTCFEDWLVEELTWAEGEARQSHKEEMNSYGAGYDAGYVAALKLILEKMTPELSGAAIEG